MEFIHIGKAPKENQEKMRELFLEGIVINPDFTGLSILWAKKAYFIFRYGSTFKRIRIPIWAAKLITKIHGSSKRRKFKT